ncbi:MAG: AAA family ATPase [Candidatus Peribacteraceae bacterium]|nr:AAA family ATPase [Candidatus Peribacteraceae bacterium]
MNTLYATLGIPASGKSTWAIEMMKKNREIININRDDLRGMIFGENYKFTRKREDMVTTTAKATANLAVLNGRDIIISDTNLNPKVFGQWKQFAGDNGYKFHVESFLDTPVGVCIERDNARKARGGRFVGTKVILQMHDKAIEHFRHMMPWLVEEDETLPSCYLVDVDGTLATMKGRSPFEWHKVGQDSLNEDVARIVNNIPYGPRIIIFSGRDGVCRPETSRWLQDNNINHYDLFMRQEGDRRSDVIVKREMFDKHIRGVYNTLGVFDDRDGVVSMWRHLGLTCFQVNYGDF